MGSSIYQDTKNRIAFYREHKENSEWDDFYHTHLDYIEKCMDFYEKNQASTEYREEYKNEEELTVGSLIGILADQNLEALVLNDSGENVRIYPGRENKRNGREVIMIC